MSANVPTITFNPTPRPEAVEEFYDKTLRAALLGMLSFNGATSPYFAAERHAREVTQKRFRVKIVLPSDEGEADA